MEQEQSIEDMNREREEKEAQVKNKITIVGRWGIT